MVCYLVWGVGQVDRPLWHIGSMTGVSIQDNADKRFHMKAHCPGEGGGTGAAGMGAAWGGRQAMAQGVERNKPEGGRWAVGRG